MKRSQGIEEIARRETVWDVLVIGGGATGLGVAVDAAARGFKTLLLEQADFAKGTSSRSTKLVHGGVRYLAQGNIRLVREALRERGYFLRNAPHLARRQAFIIPVYSLFERIKYTAGLKLYDLLAGKLGIGKSTYIRKTKVFESIPGIASTDEKPGKIKGGVRYYDGQFDDARMAVSLAATCEDLGGTVLNYMKVTALHKNSRARIDGVSAVDLETGIEYRIRAGGVINATGVFVDEIHRMDTGEGAHTVQPSQGVHLVLPSRFLQTTDYALMIPETDDGRVLFMVPWHDHLLAGTTDTPLETHTLEPRALDSEIAFILNTADKYLKEKPGPADVLSVFAGLRPLALPSGNRQSTKDISRSHKLKADASGLITITGGKWTTYRKMAEDTVDKAIEVFGLPRQPCTTTTLKIHGWSDDGTNEWNVYGTDRQKINELVHGDPSLGKKLDPAWPYTYAEVVWAARNEMARTVEDILSRRLRVLFLDARAAAGMAPAVAALLKKELQKDDAWEKKQVNDFTRLASGYLIDPAETGKAPH